MALYSVLGKLIVDRPCEGTSFHEHLAGFNGSGRNSDLAGAARAAVRRRSGVHSVPAESKIRRWTVTLSASDVPTADAVDNSSDAGSRGLNGRRNVPRCARLSAIVGKLSRRWAGLVFPAPPQCTAFRPSPESSYPAIFSVSPRSVWRRYHHHTRQGGENQKTAWGNT